MDQALKCQITKYQTPQCCRWAQGSALPVTEYALKYHQALNKYQNAKYNLVTYQYKLYMLQSYPKIPMAAAGQLCSGGPCVFWKLGSYYQQAQVARASEEGDKGARQAEEV